MARSAGLEPATLGLEGRCSIQLSYERSIAKYKLVGADGFEPPTLCSQSRCATRLRHAPPCYKNIIKSFVLLLISRVLYSNDTNTYN